MAPEPSGRAPVRERGMGNPSYRVEFQVRPAFDFLVSLEIGDGDDADILPEDRAWLATARRALPPEVRDAALTAFGRGDHKPLGVFVADLIATRPEIRSAADLVAAVDELAPIDFARVTVEEVLWHEGLTDQVEGALAGERPAIAEVSSRLPEEVAQSVLDVLREPEAWQRRVSSVLKAWLVHYAPIEARIERMLERDASRQSGRGEGVEPTELVEQATGGIRLVGDRTIRAVYLAPGYFNRPYNYIFSVDDGRVVVYPIAEESIESAEGQAPPPAVVRLYRALGDETRLRILRLLRERDRYLTEIAGDLDLSKPTVKHHLSMLRAAGLVTMTEEGSLTYYSLRRQRLAEGGAELERYLA